MPKLLIIQATGYRHARRPGPLQAAQAQAGRRSPPVPGRARAERLGRDAARRRHGGGGLRSRRGRGRHHHPDGDLSEGIRDRAGIPGPERPGADGRPTRDLPRRGDRRARRRGVHRRGRGRLPSNAGGRRGRAAREVLPPGLSGAARQHAGPAVGPARPVQVRLLPALRHPVFARVPLHVRLLRRAAPERRLRIPEPARRGGGRGHPAVREPAHLLRGQPVRGRQGPRHGVDGGPRPARDSLVHADLRPLLPRARSSWTWRSGPGCCTSTRGSRASTRRRLPPCARGSTGSSSTRRSCAT